MNRSTHIEFNKSRYELEDKYLSRYAAKSRDAVRIEPVKASEIRTDYQRDRDRIIHSKSFRRLKHKTQVFLSPEGDHYRTRLTHTLEVAQIARTIARALRLNEDLTEAIALGHDLGHTPFGHAGERTLDKLSGHFAHNEQSLRVVELLENDGEGLNLTDLVKTRFTGYTTLHDSGKVLAIIKDGQRTESAVAGDKVLGNSFFFVLSICLFLTDDVGEQTFYHFTDIAAIVHLPFNEAVRDVIH